MYSSTIIHKVNTDKAVLRYNKKKAGGSDQLVEYFQRYKSSQGLNFACIG